MCSISLLDVWGNTLDSWPSIETLFGKIGIVDRCETLGDQRRANSLGRVALLPIASNPPGRTIRARRIREKIAGRSTILFWSRTAFCRNARPELAPGRTIPIVSVTTPVLRRGIFCSAVQWCGALTRRWMAPAPGNVGRQLSLSNLHLIFPGEPLFALKSRRSLVM